MLADDEPLRELRLSNTLAVPDCYTALVVGHLLRRLYVDILQDEQPERFKTLIDKLDRTTATAERKSSERGQ